jgi:hypothetical protein
MKNHFKINFPHPRSPLLIRRGGQEEMRKEIELFKLNEV